VDTFGLSSPFAPQPGATQATQPTNSTPQAAYGNASASAPQAPTTGTYTFAQIEQLWVAAGGNPNVAPIMAAIAMAESGGNTQAQNNSGQDNSVGLWQINYHGNLLGPRTQAYGSPQQLLANPLAQAQAAVSISNNGQNLQPWSTYTSGAYTQYLPANAGANGPGVPSSGSAVGASTQQATETSALSTAGNIVGDVTNPDDIFGHLASGLGGLAKDVTPGAVAQDFLNVLFEGQTPGFIILRALEIGLGAWLMAWGGILTFKAFMDRTGATAKVEKAGMLAAAPETGGASLAALDAKLATSKPKPPSPTVTKKAPPVKASKPAPKKGYARGADQSTEDYQIFQLERSVKRRPISEGERNFKRETAARKRATGPTKKVTVEGGGDPF
jgi:hypothetical protein